MKNFNNLIIHCTTTRFIKEVLEDEEYKFLFNDLVVVDAGCNIGAFSLWILPHAKQVYAIDVAEENVDNLRKTIIDNNIANISVYQFALCGKDGNRWVSSLGGTAGGGGWQVRDLPGDGVEVNGHTLKTFMQIAHIDHIDVLKLDIEGMEQEVLHDKSFPANKVSTIIGEKHMDVDIKDRLEELGYNYRKVGSHFIARR